MGPGRPPAPGQRCDPGPPPAQPSAAAAPPLAPLPGAARQRTAGTAPPSPAPRPRRVPARGGRDRARRGSAEPGPATGRPRGPSPPGGEGTGGVGPGGGGGGEEPPRGQVEGGERPTHPSRRSRARGWRAERRLRTDRERVGSGRRSAPAPSRSPRYPPRRRGASHMAAGRARTPGQPRAEARRAARLSTTQRAHPTAGCRAVAVPSALPRRLGGAAQPAAAAAPALNLSRGA